MLVGLGAIGLLSAVALWSSQPKSPPPHSPTNNQAAPKSDRPTAKDINSYVVSSDLPRYITIPAIKVPKSRIFQLGLAKNNQIAVPDNVYDAGWYKGSAKPGQPGAMFVYGHVSSWQTDGIFYSLKKLKAGDKVTITRGDNKTFTYQVISLKVYPYNNVDMKSVLSPVTPHVPGLNLMTCTGKIIKGTNDFSQRLVVFTKQI